MAKSKNLESFCKNCGSVTKMVLSGNNDADGSFWAKCNKCKQTVLLAPDATEKAAKLSAKDAEGKEAKVYKPGEVFTVGDVVYHEKLDDTGVVLGRTILSNGNYSLTIDFRKNGQKKLIEFNNN